MIINYERAFHYNRIIHYNGEKKARNLVSHRERLPAVHHVLQTQTRGHQEADRALQLVRADDLLGSVRPREEEVGDLLERGGFRLISGA